MGQRLGTPISGNLINCTGYVVTINGITGLGTNVATFLGNALPSAMVTFLGTPSSANLRGALTDETGSGAAVFATSPTITTPDIVGTATNNSAAAGSVGELLTAGPATAALSTTIPANVTSRSLTAGDWDVWGPTQFSGAGATTTTDIQASLSLVSGTLNTTLGQYERWRGSVLDLYFPMNLGPLRLSLASTTTVYLVAQAAFSGSTYGADGFIRARRVR